MKTANYTFKCKSGIVIYGTVTLKNDGKVSVSLHNAKYMTSSADRYQAKALGKAIVASDFKHEAITHFAEQNVSTKLIEILKHETADFKRDFLIRVRKQSKSKFEYFEKLYELTSEEWLERFGKEVKSKFTFKTSTILTKEGYAMQDKVFRTIKKGFDKVLLEDLEDAEYHYKSSIEKLAYRLNQKGITDDSKFTIESGRVGVNFECTITHEKGITKCWTIVAEGDIQRAHYRYLVK